MANKAIVGNWKMNGGTATLAEVASLLAELHETEAQVTICPPATLISRIAEMAVGTSLKVGAQDCDDHASGAHTGDISAAMLADAGAECIIVGHSERRAAHSETDQMVARKARLAWDAGLAAILCVGESLEDRESGAEIQAVQRQLLASIPNPDTGEPGDLVVAYEPVWAIGSGKTPSPEQIGEMHRAIKDSIKEPLSGKIAKAPILYGGSVSGANAKEILSVPEVDGALVGGASLKARDFMPVIKAAG